MDDRQDIIELIATLLDGRNGGPIAYFMAAPRNSRRPFAVYRIMGNRELESLEGNVSGGGYVVSFLTAAHTALEGQQYSQRIRAILEGEHVAPSGLSIRVDIDDEESGAVERPEGPDDTEFQWSLDTTFYPGD